MADSYFDDEYESDSPARLEIVQRAMRWTGAAVSVSLVLGLGMWSYKMMVRDVSGVPVIQALNGPIRTAPDDPGGHKAAHQGLSVNRIAALGEAAPPPDTVTLAPRPAALAAEDVPMATPPAQRPAALPAQVILASARADEAPRLTPEGADARPTMDAEALNSRKATDARALSESAGTVEAAPETAPRSGNVFGSALDAALAEALGLDRAVIRSPRPASRPSRAGVQIAAAEASAEEIAALAAAPAPIEPDDLPPGTRLVQLGAYDDRAEAEAAWEQIEARFGAYLENRQPVIEAAESNGRSFYRLRALGFADEGESRRFCAALLAEQANCIPVMIR
jgi:hypothetical protein